MNQLSVRWGLASALLVSGGLAVAAIPAAVFELQGDLQSDALIFSGALLGGLVAALASQRRAIGEVGLGAIFTLLLFIVLLFVTDNSFSWDLESSEGRSIFFRRVGVFTVGALVGAAIGGRRRAPTPIGHGLFWALVSMLATMGVVVVTVVVLMQIALAPVALGLMIIVVTPSTGAFAAQLMAPSRQVGAITLGAASPAIFALIGNPTGFLEAAFAFALCAGVGAVGARLSLKIWPKPDEVGHAVPQAHTHG